MVDIKEDSKRTFYEVEYFKGKWSVRELMRQINRLYYERGLSRNKRKLFELANEQVDRQVSQLDIRDPYLFEFLGLKSRAVMGESNLNDMLIGKIEAFLLDLGHGFCFEARQKRIMIGGRP